jgi:hypothetical protein
VNRVIDEQELQNVLQLLAVSAKNISPIALAASVTNAAIKPTSFAMTFCYGFTCFFFAAYAAAAAAKRSSTSSAGIKMYPFAAMHFLILSVN